jgi:XTP/dITP diphosphohydrolase
MRLLLATNNPGKVREVAAILEPLCSELLSPVGLGRRFEVVENGDSFEANARLKVLAAFREFGLPAVADDSGLEIDALGGAPGVRSARFMDGSSYADKCREILRRLNGRPDRRARFVCCAALVESDGEVEVFDGICPGTIALESRGAGGFGYDPIFIPSGYEQTFAELGAELKNRISHRARAFAQVRDYLSER